VKPIRSTPGRRQTGAEAVEFALVASVFLVLLLGAIQMGLLLALWSGAGEATRYGARLAVVCDINDAHVKARMRALFPVLKSDADIQIAYSPAGCDAGSCQLATVSVLPSARLGSWIPFVPFTLSLPSFATSLPRESMQSSFNGIANPMCR
jgi:hypothetical protein